MLPGTELVRLSAAYFKTIFMNVKLNKVRFEFDKGTVVFHPTGENYFYTVLNKDAYQISHGIVKHIPTSEAISEIMESGLLNPYKNIP